MWAVFGKVTLPVAIIDFIEMKKTAPQKSKTQENNVQIPPVLIIFFNMACLITALLEFLSYFRCEVILKYRIVMIFIHFAMFFTVNIVLFIKIYDFGDHFAFCKHTMCDKVMKICMNKLYYTSNCII